MAARFRNMPTWIAAAVVAVLLAIIFILLLWRPQPAPSISLDESTKLAACRANALALAKPDKIDVALLSEVSNLCYVQVRGEDLLGDFNIRRTNYLQQQYQGNVFLWMVVTITLSGVILAALQLLAAYKLASTGRGSLDQGGEVTIEEKRLSLKSSVTGLLILTVSLAFFIVFVNWVYPLTTSNIRLDDAGQTPTPQITLGTGGLGGPPQPVPPPQAPAAPASKPDQP